uniref:Lymphocyte antigen 6 complex locus protein G6f n=1 Tax=Pogona vitticeps TaxID=103695 RepID=A0A6J0VCF9_9SAUR
MRDRVSQTFLAFIGGIFLSLRFCHAEIIYAQKGSSPQLPCLCPTCSGEHEMVTWYFHHQEKTTFLLRKKENHIERSLAAWDRLELLHNYSLLLINVTDNETGRYWCESGNYYDLVIVTGKRQMLESCQAETACYVLSCSVSERELRGVDVVSWWEGGKQLQKEDEKRGYHIFTGQRASQLHMCLKKKPRDRRLKCRFDRQAEINFNLTAQGQHFCIYNSVQTFPQGTENDCLSSQCPENSGGGVLWISLTICIILQLLIIFVLTVLLWRRTCSRKHQDHLKELSKDISKLEYKAQVYENIKTRSEIL